MYNRYVPQNDGSYSRRRIPIEQPNAPQEPCKPPAPQPCDPPPKSVPCPARQETGVFGFLRNILPKEFDTGDLMVILLLLLMAGDCQEDQNWAVLTLVLYLFL